MLASSFLVIMAAEIGSSCLAAFLRALPAQYPQDFLEAASADTPKAGSLPGLNSGLCKW